MPPSRNASTAAATAARSSPNSSSPSSQQQQHQPQSQLRLPACKRCRRRKTKCDNNIPQCTPCLKANVECISFDSTANRSIGRSYLLELEDKIKRLEASLGNNNSANNNNSNNNGNGNSNNNSKDVSFASSPDQGHNRHSSHASPISPGGGHHQHYHSHHDDHLHHNRAHPSPNHVSSRHTYGPPSLYQYLQRLPGVETDSFTRPSAASSASTVFHALPSIDQAELLNFLPDRATVDSLINQFLDYTNAAFPMFHSVELAQQVDRVFSTPFTASAEDLYVVLTVLAVSSRSMAKTLVPSSELHHTSQRFWARAQMYADDAFNAPGLRRLQFIHLHLQYIMHNPESDSVWEVSGAAMRVAVDLGLHHENNERLEFDPLESDLRRRLFWTSYCMDRNLATALGRPPSIPDDWVSAKYPADVDDSLITRQKLFPGPPSPRKVGFRHHCRLRYFQSRIQKRLYTVDAINNERPAPEWFDEMKQTLEGWFSEIPTPTLLMTKEWYQLNRYLATTMLFRPCPGNPYPRVRELEEAIQASAGVFQIFKLMLRSGIINYTWLSIHHLFISGITYLNTLNALWEKGGPGVVKCPQLIEAVLDVQTCSSLLEALTTVETSLTALRDAFEKVSGAVIRRLNAESNRSNPSQTISNISNARPGALVNRKSSQQQQQQQQQQQIINETTTSAPSSSASSAEAALAPGEPSTSTSTSTSSTTILPAVRDDYNSLPSKDSAGSNYLGNTFNNGVAVESGQLQTTTTSTSTNTNTIANTYSPAPLDLGFMNDFLFHPITGLSMQGVNSWDPSLWEEEEGSYQSTWLQ